MPGFNPLASQASQKYHTLMVPPGPPTDGGFLEHDDSYDSHPGCYLTGAATTGDRVSMKVGPKQMLTIPNKKSSYFVEWIPNNVGTAVCDIPAPGG